MSSNESCDESVHQSFDDTRADDLSWDSLHWYESFMNPSTHPKTVNDHAHQSIAFLRDKGHGPTVKNARSFGTSGCVVCSAVVQCLGGFAKPWENIEDENLLWILRPEVGFGRSESPRRLVLQTWPRETPDDCLEVDIDLSHDEQLSQENPFSWLGKNPDPGICPDILAEGGLATIKRWLSTCHDEHQGCTGASITELPTRLLDVGLGRDHNTVNLYVTGQERATYLALSHCWGNVSDASILPATTTSTIGKYTKDIPWSISRTYQDAIELTRKLGFHYLWIDSLCIVQNDKIDWEIESAKMAAVYGNAAVVIAATSASSGKDGLFLRKVDLHVIRITEASGASFTLRARARVTDQHDAFAIPHLRFDDFPLLYRGWVFQERMLAPRVVHFCKGELIWACDSQVWCECSSISPVNSTSMMNLHKGLQAGVESLINVWFAVLKAYTLCQLTYTTDRLVAISSIAQRFQTECMGRYLAGIWEHDFIFGLQWRAMFGLQEPPKLPLSKTCPPAYVPSWSWASVSYAVEQQNQPSRGRRCDNRSEIVNVYCLPQNPKAPYGNLRKAELTLRGHLLPAIYDQFINHEQGIDYGSQYLRIGSNVYLFTLDRYQDYYYTKGPLREVQVFCLWLQSSYRENRPNLAEEHGLVLEKLDTQRPTYRRIGLLDGSECVGIKGDDTDYHLRTGDGHESLKLHFLSRTKETVVIVWTNY